MNQSSFQSAPKRTSNSTFLLPHFTTKRLKPLKQSLKYGELEILDTGNIVINFKVDQHVILLNSDATVIKLFKKRNFNGGFANPDYSCRVEDSPRSIQRTLVYTSKFIDLVRSKTPKVIYSQFF